MKRLLIYGAIVIAVSLFATVSAYALDYPCADNETECSGNSFEGDESAGGNQGGGGGSEWWGGEYISCQAKGNRGQRCWETHYDPNTHRLECGGVTHMASCGCHKTTRSVIGICVYSP